MAFIDKIGEKINSGVSAVSNSTKRMTETARINNEISANAEEIDKLMKKIGLCVKARHINEIEDEEIAGYARDIDRFIARNEQLAEELKTLKGIRNCVKCGAVLPPDSVYCPECGTKNDAAASPQQMKTTTAPAPATAPVTAPQQAAAAPDPMEAYAPKQAGASQTAAPQPQQSSAATPVSPIAAYGKQQTVIFCTNCGYRETGDAIFCSNCGNKLER